MAKTFSIPVQSVDGANPTTVDLTASGAFQPGKVKTIILSAQAAWSGVLDVEVSGNGTRWDKWTQLVPGGQGVKTFTDEFLFIRTNRTGSLPTDTVPSLDLVVEAEPVSSAGVSVLITTPGQSLAVPSFTQSNTEGQKATYDTAFVGYAPQAGAADFFLLAGTAKLLRVLYVQVTGVSGAPPATGLSPGGTIDVALIKRTTPNAGGQSIFLPVTRRDSNDPIATGTPLLYLPGQGPATLGTGSLVRAKKLALAPVTGQPASAPPPWDFSTRNDRAIVLRGPNEALILSLLGLQATTLPPGTQLNLSVSWSEE